MLFGIKIDLSVKTNRIFTFFNLFLYFNFRLIFMFEQQKIYEFFTVN